MGEPWLGVVRDNQGYNKSYLIPLKPVRDPGRYDGRAEGPNRLGSTPTSFNRVAVSAPG